MQKPCPNQTVCPLKNRDYDSLFVSDMHGVEYEFRRCSRCGLIFHSPGPSEVELRKHYMGYGRYSDQAYFSTELERRKGKHLRLAEKLSKYAEKEGRKLLEVGCSNGIMLKHLSDCGYDCYGVEVDPSSSSLAKGLVGGGKIYTGFLCDSPFLDGSFDLVVCNQTIEHVPNPFEILLEINKALKRDGVLFISTPNFGGPSFRLLRDDWKNTLPGDHISMFTPRVLGNYLKWAGFRVLEEKAADFSYNRRRNSDGEYEKYPNAAMKLLFRLVGVSLTALRWGDGIAVICKKETDISGERY